MNSLSTISLNPINPDARRFLLVVADAVAPEFPEVVVMPVSRRRFEEGAPYFNTLTGIEDGWSSAAESRHDVR